MLPSLFRFSNPSLMDDFFSNNVLGGILDTTNVYSVPAVNIIENEGNFKIEVAAPGFSKEDFKINLNNEVLTISSEKKDREEEENYSRREFAYTSFARSFTLSEQLDSEKISASYKNGILCVTLPKKEEAKVKQVREIAIV